MGHNKDLNSEEQEKIAALSIADWNILNITKNLGCSRFAVRNYLDPKKNRKNTGTIMVTKRITFCIQQPI